ncbi:Steroid 5-alpha-reductase DET2 [Smittium culicis]|uniref:Steroid 5-alpha-reductase DET2 n=1 Tax=Smittium culicis TaxID=133412 RepID=A0A1R1XBD8_9FUNG|nr:Steroid 5-alpha-reductase DET2 [Smittium culicis]
MNGYINGRYARYGSGLLSSAESWNILGYKYFEFFGKISESSAIISLHRFTKSEESLYLGLVLFVIGFAINIHSDEILIRIQRRKACETKRSPLSHCRIEGPKSKVPYSISPRLDSKSQSEDSSVAEDFSVNNFHIANNQPRSSVNSDSQTVLQEETHCGDLVGSSPRKMVGDHVKERKPSSLANGTTRYAIPRGGLFELVSCPHYFGELVEWSGYTLVGGGVAGLLFVVSTAANLIPRAVQIHRWYRNEFANYPTERKAIIPFIL